MIILMYLMNLNNVNEFLILLPIFSYRKITKKQKLVTEIRSVKSQLEVYKNRYEELKRKKSFLTEDLINTTLTPGIVMDLTESQSFGSRVKHLKHLKLQYNKLAYVNLPY